MVKKKYNLLETALVFILTLTVLREFAVQNVLLLFGLAIFIILFIVISASFIHFKNLGVIRVFIFCTIVFLLYLSLLNKVITERTLNEMSSYVHDGMIMTEEASRQLIGGKNPYSISYIDLVNKEKEVSQIGRLELSHYLYSPITFYSNLPFSKFDMRLTLVVFLLLSCLIVIPVIKEKMLFSIIFLLNPLFLVSTFKGAVDVITLFFLFLSMYLLNKRKFSLATVSVALACGAKLTALPFAPIYFSYLLIYYKGRFVFGRFLKQLAIFVLIISVIYLPFVIWSFEDLLSDFVFYQLAGGESGRPIAGFLGIPQLLYHFGLISQDSKLFFSVFLLPLYGLFVFLTLKIFRNTLSISSLSLLYFFIFLLTISFSRIVQTDYLAFISQFLLLSAFIKQDSKIG